MKYKKGDKVFVVIHDSFVDDTFIDLRSLELLPAVIVSEKVHENDLYEIKYDKELYTEIEEDLLLPAQPDVEGALETLQAYIKNVLGDYKVSDKTRCD